MNKTALKKLIELDDCNLERLKNFLDQNAL